MSKKLIGKVAIVTGGSKGIGASIAEELAEEGASVVVNYSTSKEEADIVVQSIKRKDITKAAVFFASDDSAWITGETLVISGGFR